MNILDQYKQILARCLDVQDFEGLAVLIANHKKYDLFLCWEHKEFHTDNECDTYYQIATNREILKSKLEEVQTWADTWLPKLKDIITA